METKITFQVVNGNTGFEERDIEFHKLDIAIQYAIRNGFTHIHEYHGGCFKTSYDVEEVIKRDCDSLCVRVLQHNTNDQISIGMTCPTLDLDRFEQGIIEAYEKQTAWCGGFKVACEKFYKRIAIVDAETLGIIREIYNRDKE